MLRGDPTICPGPSSPRARTGNVRVNELLFGRQSIVTEPQAVRPRRRRIALPTKGIGRLMRDKESETKLLSGVAHCFAAVGMVLGGSAATSPSSQAVTIG